ncbi:alpha/beta hydrolase, partial [Burkholderia pseudomallei]
MHSTQSVSDFVTVRGVQLHVRRRRRHDAPTLYMLHGWMDVAASFRFGLAAVGGDCQVRVPHPRRVG